MTKQRKEERAARTSLETLLGPRGFNDRASNHPEAEALEARLLETVRRFKEKAHMIRREVHPDFAPEKIREAAEEVLKELQDGPASVVRLFGNRWATAMKTLEKHSGLSPSTDAANLSRENWLCDKLSAMRPSEQFQVLSRAVETGDGAMLRAALHAPQSLRIIHDEKMLDEMREAWCRQHCPEQISEYEHLGRVHEIERANYESTCDAIRQMAGIEANDLRSRLEQQQAAQD